MLFDIGVVRGAIDRKIEGQLHSIMTNRLVETVEIFQGSQPGIYRVESSRFIADRIRTSGVIGTSLQRVVRTLSIRSSYGMDGGEV